MCKLKARLKQDFVDERFRESHGRKNVKELQFLSLNALLVSGSASQFHDYLKHFHTGAYQTTILPRGPEPSKGCYNARENLPTAIPNMDPDRDFPSLPRPELSPIHTQP